MTMKPKTEMPDVRFKCTQCIFKTLFEGGALNHSITTKHFVTDAQITVDNE
jgi:hypothetical protein